MEVGPERFRKVMGHFVTGVTVVATLDEVGRPAGITVNALSSVSLAPPLIVVALDRRRFITPIVHRSGRFAVSILSEAQQALSDCFAGAPVSPGRADFCGAAWTPGSSGQPILDGAIASLECTVIGSHPIGDHDLFIGQVDDLSTEEHHAQPLLYYRRRYLRVDRAATLPVEGLQEG
ncbi:MAG: flavin reductase family protein [Chloroflexota bacterium]|nr:flavin reductase family protein [Chloroflexota bacterium]